MKKIYYLLAILAASISCSKNLQELESLSVTGKWALLEGQYECKSYITFDESSCIRYVSEDTHLLIENQIWHAARTDFKRSRISDYTVSGQNIVIDGVEKKFSLSGDTLMIDKSCYLKLEAFNPEVYSSLSITEKSISCGIDENIAELSYELQNPLADVRLTARSSVDWITEIHVADNRVTFKVTASNEEREGSLILSYPYIEDTEVRVEQSYKRTINAEATYSCDHAAGNHSIPYTIENPKQGVSLSAVCDAKWLKDLSTSSSGIIFSTDENDSVLSRSCEILLKYPGAKDKKITVVQRSSPIVRVAVGECLFNLIRVDGGTFSMGGTAEQGDRAGYNEFPVRQITLSDYMIGETEVTQKLWLEVMGSNPSKDQASLQNPVEYVSWEEITGQFIPKLNQMTGLNFSLPSEAQWEYAARGGKKSKGFIYSGSNNLDEVAWYDNSTKDGKVRAVALKAPNELGIYDMSGNVRELCLDTYVNPYPDGPLTDPVYTLPSIYGIIDRGGGAYNPQTTCRVSARSYRLMNGHDSVIGFRLVLLPTQR